MKHKIVFIIGLLLAIVVIHPPLASGEKCKLPGTKHDDNKPSEKKAEQLIKEGADVCTLAKKCDSMEIKVEIKDKAELHSKTFYKSASDDVKKELTEYSEKGHGHDSPNIVCYEIQEAINEK